MFGLWASNLWIFHRKLFFFSLAFVRFFFAIYSIYRFSDETYWADIRCHYVYWDVKSSELNWVIFGIACDLRLILRTEPPFGVHTVYSSHWLCWTIIDIINIEFLLFCIQWNECFAIAIAKQRFYDAKKIAKMKYQYFSRVPSPGARKYERLSEGITHGNLVFDLYLVSRSNWKVV